MKIKGWLMYLLGGREAIRVAYDKGFEHGCQFTSENSAKVLHMVLEKLGVCEHCAMAEIAEVTKEVTETAELERIAQLVDRQ